MKIYCMLSSSQGHIDFGGMGFLKLAKSLQENGNDILWLTTKVHADQLTKNGFNNIDAKVDALLLYPFYSLSDVRKNQQSLLQRVSYMQGLVQWLSKNKPDLILLDRILPLATLAFDQLQIPWISVGTPGANWSLQDSNVFQQQESVTAYLEAGEFIKRECGWSHGSLPSLWANSPYLNVCFMGKNFYDIAPSPATNTAYVNHFDASLTEHRRERFGFSFGNSGNASRLTPLIQHFISSTIEHPKPDVFSGSRENLYRGLQTSFGTQINLHKWVDFSQYLPLLSSLVFFGGIGTLWECVNHETPMLIVPGDIGDQASNGMAVERLSLGEYLTAIDDTQAIEQKISKLLTSHTYQDNIQAFKDASNYTDTLESMVARINNLMH